MPFTLFSASTPFIINTLKKKKVKSSQTGKGYVERNNGSISSPYMAFTCLRRGVFFSHRNWENPFYIPTIMGGLTHITYFEF